MKQGDTVKVFDRRDGVLIFAGILEKVAPNDFLGKDVATVRGRYTPEAFGKTEEAEETTICVPIACVEKGGA